jgi:hypothetical protein
MNEKAFVIPFLVMVLLIVGAITFKSYTSFDLRSNATQWTTSSGSAKKLPILVDKISVEETLDRSNAQADIVYGEGFTLISRSATGWQIMYNEPTEGQGFYESSGEITPGSSINIRSFINTSKPNGVYTGSVVVQYKLNGIWLNGPTISSKINLTGVVPARIVVPTPTSLVFTPTPTTVQCPSVSFTETKTVIGADVTVYGTSQLSSVQANPMWQTVNWDTKNSKVTLHFAVTSGTVSVYPVNNSNTQPCTSYVFGQ